MKYSQKTLHSSPERARYGVSFVSSKGNILCRLVKIELYKIFAIINRAIKGLHCIWFLHSTQLTVVNVSDSLAELVNQCQGWLQKQPLEKRPDRVDSSRRRNSPPLLVHTTEESETIMMSSSSIILNEEFERQPKTLCSTVKPLI